MLEKISVSVKYVGGNHYGDSFEVPENELEIELQVSDGRLTLFFSREGLSDTGHKTFQHLLALSFPSSVWAKINRAIADKLVADVGTLTSMQQFLQSERGLERKFREQRTGQKTK